ncbi:MAG: serine/threonine protein kinase [Planctomycetes bacterium]|nr:serine/threonine protein kinase [Planctomycetota bacterium]
MDCSKPPRDDAINNDESNEETLDLKSSSFVGVPAGVPQYIGRYRILRKIGEGGMGAVYEAEQERPKRTVALKVLKPGLASPELLRRFEQETQLLGRLQHPGIAQIYEAGTADAGAGPQPFFAMEYVRGQRLTTYAKARQLGARQRLELIARVCDAVQHAHQKGVIHRDLKPGNILVMEDDNDTTSISASGARTGSSLTSMIGVGQPKILDFGIARATDADFQAVTMHTSAGEILGTVQYMSPEQVAGDFRSVDTRSDVYALGVIAYELLAERLPYQVSRKMIHEAARIIQDDDPVSLGAVSRVFRGDVETIISKAMEKDRVRRYGSAAEMASDIRRHLADEPIVARPASIVYQVQKFTRRHRALVAGALAVFLVAIAGSIVSTLLAIRARSAEQTALVERDRARTEAAKSAQVSRFVRKILGGIGPYHAWGMDTKLIRRLIDEAEKRMGTELEGQPEVEAAIRLTLFDAYVGLGDYDLAAARLDRAEALLHDAVGDEDPAALRARASRMTLFLKLGRHGEAESLGRKVLAAQTRILGKEHEDSLATAESLAIVLTRLGNYRESEALLSRVVETRKQVLGPEDSQTLRAMHDLAITQMGEEKFAAAEANLRHVLEVRKRELGEDNTSYLESLAMLGMLKGDLDQHEECERIDREALEGLLHIYSPDNPQILNLLNNLGVCLKDGGKTREAIEVHRDTLERRRRVLGTEHPESFFSMQNLGAALQADGQFDEAEHLIREALEGRRRKLGNDHKDTIVSMKELARLLKTKGDHEGAIKLFAEALQEERNRRSPRESTLGIDCYNLGACYLDSEDYENAEPLFREVFANYEKYYKRDLPFVAATINGIAKCLESKHEFESADKFFQDALAMRRRLKPKSDFEVAYSLNDYGEALLMRKDYAAADPLLREAMKIREPLPTSDHSLQLTRSTLGVCLAGMKRFAEAEPMLVESYEQLASNPRALPRHVRLTGQRVLEFYEAWANAEPGAGHEQKAADWRAWLKPEAKQEKVDAQP